MAVAVPGPSRRAHFALGLALAAGLAVRLLAAPFHGFFGDLQDFADWGNIVIHHFGHAYSYGGHPSDLYPGSLPPAFPPLSMYAFGASVRAYLGLRHLAGAPADVNVDVPLLAALMKLPSIAADLAVGLLAFGLGREARGAAWGALLAALWLLSPVGAFDGALWGQVDVLPLPFLIAAIALAARGRGLPAGVCLGLALLWKPQAALLAPLVLLHLLRWRGPRPAMVAAAAAAAVNLLAWLPYLGGEVGAYQANVAGTFRILPFASSNAYNLWWLLGLAARPYTSALAGPLTINAAGWGLFGAVALVAALRVLWCAAAADLYIAGGLLAAGLFAFAPLQHERYIVQAAPLFLAAAALRPRALPWYGAVTLVATANLVLVALASLAPGERAGILPRLDPVPVLAGAVAVLLLALVLALSGLTLAGVRRGFAR